MVTAIEMVFLHEVYQEEKMNITQESQPHASRPTGTVNVYSREKIEKAACLQEIFIDVNGYNIIMRSLFVNTLDRESRDNLAGLALL